MPTAMQRRALIATEPAYLQKARFGNTLASLPASLPIDIGGPLVVVDSGSHASQSGGRLQFSGALGTPTQGDPGVWGATFARKVGRCLLATVNVASIASGTALQVGWDSNQATSVAKDAFQFAASGVLSILASGVAAPSIYAYTVGADYQVAVILQSLGSIWLIRGGTEYPAWTLLWVTLADATASVFPAVSGKAGVLSAAAFDVVDLGGPYVVDYGLAEGRIATTANGDTLSGLPPACLIEHTITAATGVTQELSVHRVDDNNRMVVRLSQSGATCKLIEIVAGVETERSSAAQTQTNGTQYRVVVQCDPEHAILRAWVDGSLKNGYSSWAALLTAQDAKVSHAGGGFVAWPLYPRSSPPSLSLVPAPSVASPFSASADWATARAAVATTPADVVVIGDSVTEGKTATLRGNRYVAKLRDLLRAAYPSTAAGGEGFQSATYNAGITFVLPVSTSGTVVTSSVIGLSRRAAVLSPGASITFSLVGTSCKISYAKGGFGTFTWAVDGGGTTTINTADTRLSSGNLSASIPLGATGTSHTLVITNTHATLNADIEGVFVYDQDETIGMRVHDAGLYGSTTASWVGGSNYWDACIAVVQPSLVVIELGTNDMGGGLSSASMKTNLEIIIARIKAVCIGPVEIVLLGLYERSGAFSELWANYIAAMQAIADADARVSLCDLGTSMAPVAVDTEGLYADTVHPNDTGHARIAAILAAFLEAL